jgi:hypothetical protein
MNCVGYFDLLRSVFQMPLNTACAIAPCARLANNNPNSSRCPIDLPPFYP